MQLSLLLLALCLLDGGGLAMTRQGFGLAAIRPVSGIMLALLLASRPLLWPGMLGATLIASLITGVAGGETLARTLAMGLCGIAEILGAAWPLRHLLGIASGRAPDLTRPGAMLRFVTIGMVAAPLLAGLLAAAALFLLDHVAMLPALRAWYLADALWIAAATPLLLLLLRGSAALRRSPCGTALGRRRAIAALALFLAVSLAVFAQAAYPILFLIFPVLLLLTTHGGFPAASVAIAALAVIALGATLCGSGPFMLNADIAMSDRIAGADAFVIICAVSSYAHAVVMAAKARIAAHLGHEQQRLRESQARLGDSEAQLRESEALYRLLSDNACDMVMRFRADGIITFASPSVGEVLGWRPEEMVNRPWVAFVHSEDVPELLSTMQASPASSNAADTILTTTFRALHADGGHIWLESRSRLVSARPPSTAREFVAHARDITRRKLAGDALARLAGTDALTGLPNRRHFDEALQREWRRAGRAEAMLTLLMIDVDNFKSYNDRYGHPAGDQALRAIAQAMAATPRRAGDLLARYGGEEFVALLTAVDARGGQRIAEEMRRNVESLAIPHERSSNGQVTISVGIASMAARSDGEPETLILLADAILYRAKREGRNRVCGV